MNPFQEEREKKIPFKLVFACAALLLVTALALFEYFLPLKTLLPAARTNGAGEEMRVHFLDVGQGDCTVVEFADGEVLVVDAGDGSFEHENALVRYLKGLRAKEIFIAVTHADVDHYGGFTELLSCFRVKRAYLPAMESARPEYRNFLSAVRNAGCETQTLSRYTAIGAKAGGYVCCISPYSEGEENDNDASAVLWLSYGGVNILLGGDISAARERLLLREYALGEGVFDCGKLPVRLEDTHILRVSHHGSAYSSCAEWLEFLNAETAVISCGRGNSYEHPAAGAVKRIAETGAEIYRTDELGHVTVGISEGKYTVYTDLEQRI